METEVMEDKYPRVKKLGDVYLLDTQHLGRIGIIGAFLVPGQGGSFTLIESGPASVILILVASIKEAGFEPEGLEALFVTHAHLDHAGAAGALAKRYGAKVYVHEAGFPHLADPSRLLASAQRIYKDQMQTLWGQMEAVPESQLYMVKDGERLHVGGHKVDALYTPGHASHHISYLLDRRTLFAGDSAGIKLPGSSVIFPATPPPEVNLEVWDKSLDTMRRADPERLLLTHFGEIHDVQTHLELVGTQNHKWAEAVLEGLKKGKDDETLEAHVKMIGQSELEHEGASADIVDRYFFACSSKITTLGLKRYWKKWHPELLQS